MLTGNNFFSAKVKCVSATFADFYKRVVSPFPFAARYLFVNIPPLMKIPKIDTQHPGPKNEISKFQNGRLLHRRQTTILYTNRTYPSEN